MTIFGSDKENLLSLLEGFDPDTAHGIDRNLYKYLQYVASSGQTIAPWKLAQPLFLWATARAMDSLQGVAPCPLLTDKSHINERCDIIPYAQLRSHILDQLRGFVAAPFTIQRLCELILFGLEIDSETFIYDQPNSVTLSNVQNTETSFVPTIKPSETTPSSAEPGSLQAAQPVEALETSVSRTDDITVEQTQSFSQTSILDSSASVRDRHSLPYVKRQYMRADKYIRALEKALQVVSTVDPFGKKYLEDPRLATSSEEAISANFLNGNSLLVDASEARLSNPVASSGVHTPRVTMPESSAVAEPEACLEGALYSSSGVERTFQSLFESHTVPLVVPASRTPPHQPNPMLQLGSSPTHERVEHSEGLSMHDRHSPQLQQQPSSDSDSAFGDRETISVRSNSGSSASAFSLMEAMQVDTELEPSDELVAERSSTPEFMPPESEAPTSPLAVCWPRSPARSPSHSPCEPVLHTPGSPRYVGAVDEVDFSASLHVPLAAAFAAAAHHPSHVETPEADDRREVLLQLHPDAAHLQHSPIRITEPDTKRHNEGNLEDAAP